MLVSTLPVSPGLVAPAPVSLHASLSRAAGAGGGALAVPAAGGCVLGWGEQVLPVLVGSACSDPLGVMQEGSGDKMKTQ